MKIEYKPLGVCCKQFDLEIENNKIVSLNFVGGCDGNLRGIAELVKGMNVDAVIAKLKGLPCGAKSTSCPDQLALCLMEYSQTVKFEKSII